jgi:hypothetical protein
MPASSGEAAASGCSRSEPAHATRQQAETGDLAFFGRFEQQLHADADAEQRRFARAQGDIEPAFAQQRHRRRGGADAGQDDALGIAEFGGIAHQPRRGADPAQRNHHRTEVGTAGVDQGEIAAVGSDAHNAPLVLGSASPSRRIDWRSARATALKQASIL